jgi:hypothetical protein
VLKALDEDDYPYSECVGQIVRDRNCNVELITLNNNEITEYLES